MLFALTFFPFNLALAWTGPFREDIEAVEAASDAGQSKRPSRSSRQSKWCGVGQQHNNSGIIWWQSTLFLCCVDPSSHLSLEAIPVSVYVTFSSKYKKHINRIRSFQNKKRDMVVDRPLTHDEIGGRKRHECSSLTKISGEKEIERIRLVREKLAGNFGMQMWYIWQDHGNIIFHPKLIIWLVILFFYL